MVLGFILFMRKSRLHAEVTVILVKGLKLVLRFKQFFESQTSLLAIGRLTRTKREFLENQNFSLLSNVPFLRLFFILLRT